MLKKGLVRNTSFCAPKYSLSLRKKSSDIGILVADYGLAKVSFGLPLENYQFVRCLSYGSISSGLGYETKRVIGGSAQMIHSWNEIVRNRPFIVSYELEIPRFLNNPSNSEIKTGFSYLAEDNCLGLYALSKAAADYGQTRAREFGFDSVADKIEVFHGGIEVADNSNYKAEKTGDLKLLFVGNQPFRKGLLPTLRALKKIYDSGLKLHLNVVSSFFVDDCYVYRDQLPDKGVLQQYFDEPWVTVSRGVAHSDLMAQMRDTDVLLFPTFDESLGWVNREAALSEVPTITTNIFAVAEPFTHKKDAWVIDLPLREDSRWCGIGAPSDSLGNLLSEAESIIEQGIIDCFTFTDGKREVFKEWGERAKRTSEEIYSRTKAASTLSSIYKEKLALL